VGQRQGPQPQVRCRVGDGAQDKLNRLDDLVNHNFTEFKCVAVFVISMQTTLLLLLLLQSWLKQQQHLPFGDHVSTTTASPTT
jgi:hypothetical protein